MSDPIRTRRIQPTLDSAEAAKAWAAVLDALRDALASYAREKEAAADRKALYGEALTLLRRWQEDYPEYRRFEVGIDEKVGGALLTWVEGGSTTSINPKVLLDRGVDPAIIREATTKKPRAGHLEVERVTPEILRDPKHLMEVDGA